MGNEIALFRYPFTLSIDGTGVEKMNPFTVRIFNAEYGMVYTQLLDMCMSSQSTAEGISRSSCNSVWLNCAGVSDDNTSVNMGCNKDKTPRSKLQPLMHAWVARAT